MTNSLSDMRGQLGWPQARLATALGIRQSGVSRMENAPASFTEKYRLAMIGLLALHGHTLPDLPPSNQLQTNGGRND